MRPWILLLAGCASTGLPEIVEPSRMTPETAPPSLVRLIDVGQVALPARGPWKADSDQTVTSGELLFVDGKNLGPKPTIQIGGRDAPIVARTQGGGAIVRVPRGLVGADATVLVRSSRGQAEDKVKVRRWGVVAFNNTLHFLEVGQELKASGKTTLRGAYKLRIAKGGSVAYVLARGTEATLKKDAAGKETIANDAQPDRLAVLDLNAALLPQIRTEVKLAHRAQFLSVASDGELVGVIGEGKVTLFSPPSMQELGAGITMDLPKETQKVQAAELSVDGKLLVVLIGEGNRLVAFEIGRAQATMTLKQVASLDLLPGETLPLVRSLSFSDDGENMWVVSGDNSKTLPVFQPTRLTVLRLGRDDKKADPKAEAKPEPAKAEAPKAEPSKPEVKTKPRLLSSWRTQSLPGAAAPLQMIVRNAVGNEPQAVLITAVNPSLFKLGELKLDTEDGAAKAAELWKPPNPGMVVRGDASGGGPLFSTPQILFSLDLMPDEKTLVATSARVALAPAMGRVAVEYGITVAPLASASVPPVFLPLEQSAPEIIKPPFSLGDIRIQP